MINPHGIFGVRKKRFIRKRFKWVKGTIPHGWKIWNTDKDGYWTTPNADLAPVDYWWWKEFTHGNHHLQKFGRWPVR